MAINKKLEQKGFTLIEIIIMIAVTSIIFAVISVSYVGVIQSNDLSIQGQAITNILQTARERSLTRFGNNQYGVHFTANTYILFTGTSYLSNDPNNIVYTLPSDLKISNISLDVNNSIVFNVISGSVYSPSTGGGNLQISTLIGNSSNTVSINARGSISIQ